MKKSDYVHAIYNIKFLDKWILDSNGRKAPRRRTDIMCHKLLMRTLPLLESALQYIPEDIELLDRNPRSLHKTVCLEDGFYKKEKL